MASKISVLELRSVRGTGGGPEKTILLSAARRDRGRFDVTVCYIRDTRDEVFGIDARAENIGIDYVEVREKHSFDASIWRELTTIVRDRRIAIVHSHDYKTDLLALLLGRRTSAIPLATAHGWTGHTPRERWVYYPVDRWLLARFPCVIAVSTDIKEELVRSGARPERIEVVLNAIDPHAFRRSNRRLEARRALGLPADALVVGAVGRVEPQKRFDLLLSAMQPILAERRDARLVIVGDGTALPALMAQASAQGISGQCVFTGHRHDIADLHEAFDLFVQSSDYEGTPNALLEAMAMETPIVATDVGGTAELAIDGVHGLIVPRQNPLALTEAIRMALVDPDAALGRARRARARVENELSFEARTRRVEAIYAHLVGMADA